MLVDGFVTPNDLFLTAINWGHYYEKYFSIVKKHKNYRRLQDARLEDWKRFVEKRIVPEYDVQCKGTYAFRKEDVNEVAERLMNYYENYVKEM